METLSALISELGMKPDRVAVELNREIVPREQWTQTVLQDGDRLEIVHFVGGGWEPTAKKKQLEGFLAILTNRIWRSRAGRGIECLA